MVSDIYGNATEYNFEILESANGAVIALIVIGVIAACVLLPLLIAYFMMKNKLRKMNTAVSDDYAENYQKSESLNLKVSRDLFLYSNIIKTEKPKSQNPEGNYEAYIDYFPY